MIVAIDVGGTRIKCGVVDNATVRARAIVATPESASDALDLAFKTVNELTEGEKPERAGLCVPGLVDEHGVVVSLPGKLHGIEGLPLRQLVAESTGAEAAVCNDAIAYGVAEAVRGAGRSSTRCVVVTIGTGVGVTVLDHGRPVTTGPLGGGILGGFIPITQTSEYTDSNGGRDSIEALCSAQRIVDRANECGGAFQDVPGVYEAFHANDRAAVEGIERYRIDLIRALVALAHAHAPDLFVIGGGPIAANNPLLSDVSDAVNKRLYSRYRVEVRAAELGDDAALIGLEHIARSNP